MKALRELAEVPAMFMAMAAAVAAVAALGAGALYVVGLAHEAQPGLTLFAVGLGTLAFGYWLGHRR